MLSDLLSGFEDEPWNYMYTVYSKTLKSYTFATDGYDPFIYDTDLGRYVPGDDRLRRILADSMKHEWSPARVNHIFTWYKDRAPKLWDTPPLDRVNVLNGIINLKSGELEPHSPDFLSPVQINAAWDPDAQCPAIDEFVQQVFPDDARDLFYQLAGLFLVPDSRCRKAVLFLGPSATGKSLALTLLRTFLHSRNVSNIPLHDLVGGSFALSELRGKLLNISADVPDRDFNDTAIFKQIVDGRLAVLRAPRKLRDPIEFQPFTRLIASTNRVPRSADNSLGYLRRWFIVPFDNELQDGASDHSLLDLLTTPNELSGLLNRAAKYCHPVLSSGKLRHSAKINEANDKFVLASDSTRLFLDEKVQECSLSTSTWTAPSSTACTRTGATSTASAPSARTASTAPSGTSSESKRTTPTDAGCSGASASPLKLSRRGQKVQTVHKQGRKVQTVQVCPPKLDHPSLSFEECRQCR